MDLDSDNTAQHRFLLEALYRLSAAGDTGGEAFSRLEREIYSLLCSAYGHSGPGPTDGAG